MNMLLNWGQRCAQGKARSKSAAVRFWGRHDYWEQVTFRVHYKVILFNLFGSHLKLWLLPLKRLHTFFPSMRRPAPRRLKWFTAGHITTVIRDRRIYNFLSLNTSLRIIFFYDCAVRTVFHGFGLFTAFSAGRVVFACRPCDEAVTAISTGPVWRCSVLMCWVQERIRTVVLQCLAQGHWGEPKSVTGRKME